MKFNAQLDLIEQSATVAIFDKVQTLIAAGEDIIPLQVGDPDFETHPAIIQAASEAMRSGQTHYASSRGLPALRQAAADKLARDNAIPGQGPMNYNPGSEILATHGGIHAYYLAVQSILTPGDEVLIPDPSWATHTNMVKLLRGRPVHISAPPENGFLPKISDWREAVSSKTTALVINYPANPTGVYPDRAYLQAIHDLATEHHLWIISDEVYQNIYYEDKPVSAGAFAGAKKHTLLVNSLSKTYAMTGWRIGYLAGPAAIISRALKASQNSITCAAPFIQTAAAEALSSQEVQAASDEMRQTYARRRQLVLDTAHKYPESPITIAAPQGAFYFFLDCRRLQMPSVDICELLLDEVGVGLVPGSAFGDQGEGFIRMTIAASEEHIEAGFRRIMEWASNRKKQ